MSMSSDVQTLERPCVERVFECMSDAIWTIDASSGEMLYLNPAAERLYGRSLQQFQEGARLGLNNSLRAIAIGFAISRRASNIRMKALI